MADKPLFTPEIADKYAHACDLHLRGIIDCIPALHDLSSALRDSASRKLDDCMVEINKIHEMNRLIMERLDKMGAPQIDLYERTMQFIHGKLVGEEWPSAVPPGQIVRSPEAESYRAKTILDLLVTEFVKDLRFLEVGCGNGLVCKAAYERGARVAIGVDSDTKLKWDFGNDPHGQLRLSHSFADADFDKPYDIVLLYDVLDHSEQDPVQLLQTIKNMLSNRGRVYIRTHPWCGRHGSHLYEQINKAYLHLVLDDIELTRIGGYHAPFVRRLTRPIETYHKWFSEAGYVIRSETICRNDIEGFFLGSENLAIRDKIKAHWQGDDPIPHMSIEFVDYMLEPDKSYNVA